MAWRASIRRRTSAASSGRPAHSSSIVSGRALVPHHFPAIDQIIDPRLGFHGGPRLAIRAISYGHSAAEPLVELDPGRTPAVPAPPAR